MIAYAIFTPENQMLLHAIGPSAQSCWENYGAVIGGSHPLQRIESAKKLGYTCREVRIHESEPDRDEQPKDGYDYRNG